MSGCFEQSPAIIRLTFFRVSRPVRESPPTSSRNAASSAGAVRKWNASVALPPTDARKW